MNSSAGCTTNYYQQQQEKYTFQCHRTDSYACGKDARKVEINSNVVFSDRQNRIVIKINIIE